MPQDLHLGAQELKVCSAEVELLTLQYINYLLAVLDVVY